MTRFSTFTDQELEIFQGIWQSIDAEFPAKDILPDESIEENKGFWEDFERIGKEINAELYDRGC